MNVTRASAKLGGLFALVTACSSPSAAPEASSARRPRSKAASATATAASGASAAATSVQTSPTCATPGCVRGVERVGSYDRATIESALQPGVHVDNGYAIATLTFFTSGREARATVATPVGAPSPARGLDVVANAHGTTGLDDPCRIAGTLAGAGIAGTFGARGFIGVAIDYPGLGTDGLQPYLVADVEGHAALDAVRATLAFAKTEGLGVSGRAAIVGLSQGGHATLAAAAMHHDYAPELDVRGFAVVAPASGWEEHFRLGARFDGDLAAVQAMLLYGWSKHYGWAGPPIFAAQTASIIDDAMRTACALPGLGAPTLTEKLGTRMSDIFDPAFLAAYRDGPWGPYAAFGEWFAKNRIGPYRQTAPLKIFQGDADAIVPEPATRQLVDALRAGRVDVDYEVVPGGTHTNVAFGFVAYPELRTDASIAWLRARLDADR